MKAWKMLKSLDEILRIAQSIARHVFVTGPSMGGLGAYVLRERHADTIAGYMLKAGGKDIYAHRLGDPLAYFVHGHNDACIDVSETDRIASTKGFCKNISTSE